MCLPFDRNKGKLIFLKCRSLRDVLEDLNVISAQLANQE